MTALRPGAAPTRGVQAEVLASLALVMLTATALLSAFFLKTNTAQIDQLQGLLGRALVAEARSPTFVMDQVSPEVRWWTVRVGEGARAKGRIDDRATLDSDGLALAEAARRRDEPLLDTGVPWEPIRFAVELPQGQVAVAELPPAVSPWSVLALLIADVLVFTAFGATLLRRRVVQPLRLLAEGARAVREGDLSTRVPLEGVGEAVEVGRAFNEMSESLEQRTGDLEKAVRDLRDTNASLTRARDGLDRAERLAAVGRLAAGVAHEVGNPMGALLAFLDLAGRDTGLSDQGKSHLERASGQGERVRVILRQLLDFSRPPRSKLVPLELAALADQTVSLLRAQKRYSAIEIAVEGEDSTPQALGDESMVVQILLNLLINAGDAVAESASPRILVSVRPAPLRLRRGEEAAESARRGAPDAVACVIADNGPGIGEADEERIFDPFFTTKAPGEGTGLGLANAQKLAEELGGTLQITTSPLGGAAFRLALPALKTDSPTSGDSAGVRRA